ncbi:hypothetical protein FisN_11Hh074 [Fistulifera solaris]|uniref:Uncharacterized protein n=1 Tax=Fistulifera solaris TaxID=1519565 RepID=A0A1Z5JKC7_FISSO|nr:hypothetical protein FisN_11Hh074 [Fistulifera solaris]|eukprot:GAX14465.1 hypothetical protein FisN_11Hh074 [Fistulifera solaris]
MQRDETPLRPNTPAPYGLTGFMSQKEVELNTFAQYFLLIAVASQLGDILDELIEIIELHLHTFPVLVVLGVLPRIFLKKSKAQATKSICSNQKNSSLVSLSSADILRDMEKYYATKGEDEAVPQLDVKSPPQLRRVATPTNQGDEWGHFADFDDCVDPVGESFCFQRQDSGPRAVLSPLHETEIDE